MDNLPDCTLKEKKQSPSATINCQYFREEPHGPTPFHDEIGGPVSCRRGPGSTCSCCSEFMSGNNYK